MSRKIERIMKVAYRATFRSEHDQAMAAVLVKGSRIISVGINYLNKTHPDQKERVCRNGRIVSNNRIHAELDALIRADHENIIGSTLYVIRRKKNMDLGLARPCTACAELVKSYGIKKIVYSTDTSILSVANYQEERV